MCEMVSRFWFVCHFSVAGLSHEISACMDKCPAVDHLDANTPDYKKPISQTIAGVLMRRRSLQLLSRLRRFRSFPGFSAVWTFNANSRMLQSTHHPEIFGISTIAPAPNHDSDREEFSGRVVTTSTTTASASARGSPECAGCQKTANCFPCLSISKLCLKSCDRLP